MVTSPRIFLPPQVVLALGIACLTGAAGGAIAEPQAGAPPAAGDAPAPKGDFFSSLKQAFKQDLEHEVVRGHFDVGTPPDAHRYYCLVDAKTGKTEANGVGGEPVVRADGMTGIKNGAVSFYNCASAEQQGTLVTSGYTLTPAVRAKLQPAPAPAAPRDSTSAGASPLPGAATSLPAAAAVPAAGAVPAALPAPAPTGMLQTEIMAAFTRFVAGQNAHDRGAVADVLLDSKEFVWGQSGGNSLWGHQAAMEGFQEQWKGTWSLEPQYPEVRIAGMTPDVAVLVAPLLVTQGDPGAAPATAPVRWSGVFVKTPSGWRLASIFTTPFKNWQPAAPR